MIISAETFKKKLDSLLSASDNTLVSAVSGGRDSLALAFLVNEYANKAGIKSIAAMVDHKLRPESRRELEHTAITLKSHGINCEILTWHHDEDIGGNMEKKARDARYSLLCEFCKSIGASKLLVAHHALDQWETFFMRLSKGSALNGLCSMRDISRHGSVEIIRPLLDIPPADIVETLNVRFKITDYVQDPHNDDIKFERVRWRKTYEDLARYGPDIDAISKTTSRLQVAESCLDQIAEERFSEFKNSGAIDLKKFRSCHLEIQMRLIRKTLQNLCEESRIVSYDLLLRTVNNINSSGFKATNLSGIVIRRSKNKLFFKKENRD